MEKINACGKWVLVGEHAVIRGMPAIALPLKSKKLILEWSRSKNSSFKSPTHGEAASSILKYMLSYGAKIANIPVPDHWGDFILSSTIPIGSGLGSSASICVAIAKWFRKRGYISQADIFDFAKRLEDTLHKESSGMDIAVVLSERPILFSRIDGIKDININWKPYLYLSYSGICHSTADAVMQVKSFGTSLDHQMAEATQLCVEGLTGLNYIDKIRQLTEGINLACDCFETWGLVSKELQEYMDNLTAEGALAVKPTGSGGGGYILSLWDKEPPLYIIDSLVSAMSA